MAQPPNIEIELADLPPAEPVPEPSRWEQRRPGEITSPAEAVWGGAFGHPGPDAGYALKLVGLVDFDRSDGPELDHVVAALAAARAASIGRGPTLKDIEAALTILGLRPEGLPGDVVEKLAERRREALHHAAHERDKGRWLLEQIPNELLAAPAGELARRLAA